jgi:hypothetical protein
MDITKFAYVFVPAMIFGEGLVRAIKDARHVSQFRDRPR